MSILKLIKSIATYLTIFVVILITGLFWVTANDRAIDYEVETVGISIPTFIEQTIDFVPTYDAKNTVPFTASAVIDIDGDGVEEVFFGGGINQNDAFYKFAETRFVDITSQTEW